MAPQSILRRHGEETGSSGVAKELEAESKTAAKICFDKALQVAFPTSVNSVSRSPNIGAL